MAEISSPAAVDEHYLSPASDQELLFENRGARTSLYGDSADVSSSEEGPANAVGNLTTAVHSGGTAEEQGKVTLKREITAFSGVFVVINQFIGSGIFITQSGILNYAGSFGVSLLCWVFGWTVALAGAMCYLELGLLVRKTGGEYAILLEAFSFRKKNRWVEMLGSLVSFLYTWTNVLLLRGVAVSIITMTCARNLTRPFFIGCEVPEAAVKLIALAVLLILILVNIYGIKLTVQVTMLFSGLKLLAIVFIVAVGAITVSVRQCVPDRLHQPFQPLEGHQPSVSSVALALYGVLWAYDACYSIMAQAGILTLEFLPLRPATDADVGNNSIVYFRILSNNVPYVVDRDSGVVTTAGVFTGDSGVIHSIEVEAYDNFGIPPTNRRTGILTVRVYRLTDQVIITFGREKDLVEAKLDRIQSALEEVTEGDVTITEVRVEQTEDGSVDTTGTDILFFTVQPVDGKVISPYTVIRLIDARYSVVEKVFTDCDVQEIGVFKPDLLVATGIPYWVWIILGMLGLIIICLCCCFLIGCVIERRRNRRWRKQSTIQRSNTSELEQFSLYNYHRQNPAYISPNVDWPDITTSEVTSVSTIDQPNPLYASQEIEVDMPPEETDVETASRASRLSAESQEFRMEMYNDDASLEGPGDSSSTENLVSSSRKRTSTPYGKASRYSDYGTDEDMLARAIQDTDEDDENESKTSYI